MDNNIIETNFEENKGNKNKTFNFKYKVEEDNSEIWIFREEFVRNNKGKCYLVINNIDSELSCKYTFPKKGEQTVSLVITDENINFKGMFFLNIII